MEVRVLTKSGTEEKFIYNGDKSLLAYLRTIFPGLIAPCGGRGTCGKCTIRVIKGDIPYTSFDTRFFNDDVIRQGYRLGCMAYPKSDCIIELGKNDEKDIQIVSTYKPKNFNIDPLVNQYTITCTQDELSSMSMLSLVKRKINFKNIYLKHVLRKIGKILDPSKVSYPMNCTCIIVNDTLVNIVYKPYTTTYSISIDIGTTTIAIYLINNESGEIICQKRFLNPQRSVGSDVISRLQYIEDNDVEDLHRKTVAVVEKNILDCIGNYDIDIEALCHIIVTGNTIMLHIFAGIHASSIGQSPFACSFLESIAFHSQELFNSIPSAMVTFVPCFSAYVGGDLASGALYADMDLKKDPILLMDIGTNGEMLLGNKDRLFCVSTAAGPAFEGGNISCGTGSIPGAVSSVKWTEGSWVIETIDDEPPIGICGSGIIDIIAECLRHGLIDETGYIMEPNGGKIVISRDMEGKEIYISQQDVRQIQLAKAAMRAGMERLIEEWGSGYEEIKSVYIAGGFGYHANQDNIAAIGMIPKELEDKIIVVGNSAIAGAVQYALDKGSHSRVDEMCKKAVTLNLGADPRFNDLFVDSMYFDNASIR